MSEEILAKEYYENLYKEAREQLKDSKDAFALIDEEFIDDVEFGLLGKQWKAQELNSRRNENRTAGVFNKCVSNIRYVVNGTMKNTPAILVHPLTEAKKEVAEVYKGLIRHIENESNAKDIYTNTLQDSVAGGFGVFEIVTEECPGKNYTELKIKRIVDPTKVFVDPTTIEPDLSDISYLFHIKQITRKKFEKDYPNASIDEIDSDSNEWFTKDMITIAEYWVKNGDGSVSWHILNGCEIIDSSEWREEGYPGKIIPYCFVIGEDIMINGERHFKSIIRDIKDYQRTLNYMQSEAIDYVGKAAKTPWLVGDASIAPYKEIWDSANTKNLPYLPHVEGKSVPQRNDPPPSPIGYLESVNRLDQDIRQTIGIRDPLQDIPASQSGKAIQLQLAQGNLGTYVWIDHLNRAIKRCGKILVDLIPHYYNHPHIQQILGIDGLIKTVEINTPKLNQETGEVEVLDLSGEYSVTISTGATYEDQQAETQDKLLEIFKMNPGLMQLGGDILVRNMDFAESNELADRITQTMDPKILSQSKSSEQQLKLQLNQITQEFSKVNGMIEQLTQVLNAKNQEVEILNAKLSDKQNSEMLEVEKNTQDNETILLKTHMENDVEQKKIESEERIKMLELELEKLKLMFTKPEVKIQNYTDSTTTTTIL